MHASVTIQYRTTTTCNTWVGYAQGKDHESIAADCVARLKRRIRSLTRIDCVSVVRTDSPSGICEHRWQRIAEHGATVGYDARCARCGETATFIPRED